MQGGSGANSNNGVAQGADIFIMSGGRLTFDSSEDIEVPNAIEGNQGILGGTSSNGFFQKNGTGTLTLQANNTFDGQVTLTLGTLSIPEESGLGVSSEAVLLNGGILEITTGSEQLSKTYTVGSGGVSISIPASSIVSQAPNDGAINAASGLVTKIGTGNLVLERSTNTFGGNITITEGTLTGTPTSIPASTITNNSALVFDIGGTNTFSNTVAGSGGVTLKEGAGTLNIASSASFSSDNDFTVVGGSINLNSGSNLAGDQVTVNDGGTLKGIGTVTAGTMFTNNGNVTPGNSIGTITVVGDFTQGSTGNFDVEIDKDGNSDLLDISGTASLAGGVSVFPSPGVYRDEYQYTILTADGGVSGIFDALSTSSSLSFSLEYLANSVILHIDSHGIVLPVSLSQLIYNEKVVADYFCCVSPQIEGDLEEVQSVVLNLSPREFPSALLRLSSQPYTSLTLANMRSAVQFMDYLEGFSCCNCNQISMTPFTNFYNQQVTDKQYAFRSATYGMTFNANREINPYLCAGMFLTYTFSHLFWEENVGNAGLNNVYIGPYINVKGFQKSFFFTIFGAWNDYDVTRHIVFTGMDRTAKSDHTGGALFSRAQASFDFLVSRSIDYYFGMKFGASYASYWQESFEEYGADSISLNLERQQMQFFVPYALFDLHKYYLKDTVKPRIYLGWEALVNLGNNQNRSTFTNRKLCKLFMNTLAYNQNTNEIRIGMDLMWKKSEYSCLDIGYEVKAGNNFWIQQGFLKMVLKF